MNEEQALEIMAATGAVLTNDHFVYTSGLHGSAYVNKDAVYPYTTLIKQLCSAIAHHFYDDDIESVVAPEKGGIILSQWVADYLSSLKEKQVFAVFVEKTNDGSGFHFTRGYNQYVVGRKILIVEDILTTGGSALQVVNLVRESGGLVLGVGVLCNRGGVTAQKLGGIPELFALTNVPLQTWLEDECPLCAQGIPVNIQVGKGREFLARKQSI